MTVFGAAWLDDRHLGLYHELNLQWWFNWNARNALTHTDAIPIWRKGRKKYKGAVPKSFREHIGYDGYGLAIFENEPDQDHKPKVAVRNFLMMKLNYPNLTWLAPNTVLIPGWKKGRTGKVVLPADRDYLDAFIQQVYVMGRGVLGGRIDKRLPFELCLHGYDVTGKGADHAAELVQHAYETATRKRTYWWRNTRYTAEPVINKGEIHVIETGTDKPEVMEAWLKYYKSESLLGYVGLYTPYQPAGKFWASHAFYVGHKVHEGTPQERTEVRITDVGRVVRDFFK